MKRVRRLALLTIAAVLAVGATAAMTASASASASAAAVVTRVSMTGSGGPEPIQSDDCGAGMISGTDTLTYTSVQTPTGGFHIAGSEVANGRIDWSDGRYTLIGFTDHFAFNTNAGTTVNPLAHTDFMDTYSAGGVLESQGTFHSVEQIVVTNGTIVRVEFDHNHIRGTFCDLPG
jgi:hypothetical protein